MKWPISTNALSWRQWVVDGSAGLAVAGVLLPEAVAYAAIAGVLPMHAFIAALCGLLIYPLLGSSRFAIVAPTSSAAAVFASTVATGGADLGFALVGLTAGLFLLAAALKADFLSAFISRPVLRGFAWALAITIVLKQLPHMLGMHATTSKPFPLAWELLTHLAEAHLPSLRMGLIALAAWLFLKHVVLRWLLLPPSLIVLMAGIVWQAYGAADNSGVALVSPIQWDGLRFSLPHLTLEAWQHAAQIAPALLVILFAESWGSVRSLALQTGDHVSTRRELAALGVTNLISALLQGLPVGAGFSAAMANQSAGAQTKLAGVAAGVALGALLWLGQEWLAYLPIPVLAAVVAGILSHNLWPHSIIASLRLGKDAWLAFVAATSVLLFGVLFGMLVAVALSLILAVKRFSEPLVAEIARFPGTRNFIDIRHHAELEQPPQGLLLMRPEEPLFFANAEGILKKVREQVQRKQARLVILSMEMCDDLDSTSVEALAECVATLKKIDCDVWIARLKDRARSTLQAAGWVDSDTAQKTGTAAPSHELFWSVEDAYEAALATGRFTAA